MANGTIAFDTLQTSGQITGTAKSVDTDYVVNGSAKAWGHLNMSTGSFADSFNNSSATDYQTGSFHHNFTNAFANSSYSISGSHNSASSNTASVVVGLDDSARMTTTSVNVAAFNATGRVDATKVLTKVMGEIA
jgi:hypothetical protein